MPIGALNDIIITITNVIRKSEYASSIFTGSDEAEARFDDWQGKVLDKAQKIYGHWDSDVYISMFMTGELEKLLYDIFPPKEIEVNLTF